MTLAADAKMEYAPGKASSACADRPSDSICRVRYSGDRAQGTWMRQLAGGRAGGQAGRWLAGWLDYLR